MKLLVSLISFLSLLGCAHTRYSVHADIPPLLLAQTSERYTTANPSRHVQIPEGIYVPKFRDRSGIYYQGEKPISVLGVTRSDVYLFISSVVPTEKHGLLLGADVPVDWLNKPIPLRAPDSESPDIPEVMRLARSATRLVIADERPSNGERQGPSASVEVVGERSLRHFLAVLSLAKEPVRGIKTVVGDMTILDVAYCQCLSDYSFRFYRKDKEVLAFGLNHWSHIRLTKGKHSHDIDLEPASVKKLESELNALFKKSG